MSYRIAKPGFILLLALLLGACASQVPLPIREAPADSPSLAVVRAQDADYLGQRVRWGGTIIETGNRENATWLTVLGKPLDKSGEPGFGDDSAGRFIAIVPGFLDPKVYAPDRRVTVSGTLSRFECRHGRGIFLSLSCGTGGCLVPVGQGSQTARRLRRSLALRSLVLPAVVRSLASLRLPLPPLALRRIMMLLRFYLLFILLLLLSACASSPGLDSSGADRSLTPRGIAAAPQPAGGKQVLWGGVIVHTS